MSFTKENLAGLEVYDAEGHLKGIVKDLAFTVGKETISLVIGKDKNQNEVISWSQIQAIGKIIILKKQEEAPKQICPSCNGPLRWIPQYNRWYCDKEKKYA